jgi:16S rRNA (guanine1207-N2)-methyltransferase
MEKLSSPFGELILKRWPQRKNDILRAWDAADEYLLEYISEQQLPEQGSAVLVVNDSFGALACALKEYEVTSWSDSKVSHIATTANLISNDYEAGFAEQTSTVEYLDSMQSPQQSPSLVLIKIPKTMALLEDQLLKLRPHLTNNTVIVAAGMIKHLPKSAFQLLEKYVGPLTTSLAKKKARLLFVKVDLALTIPESPYPTSYTVDELSMTLSNHANLFSRDHLDIGARFFLTQFKHLPAAEKVVDLACGNGVLGIRYAQMHSEANVQFTDESYMAMASTLDNYTSIIGNDLSAAKFITDDGLKQIADSSVNLVLCNPPFHQQHVIGEQIAMELFSQSKRCLQVGGELWIVANSHLDYQSKLKKLFGNCRVVDANKKFVVLRVVKR